jgi:nucleoside-diphosphate-sugar epimerase
MRVLIIGCGYIGLPLGAKLVREGHEVHGIRRTPAADGELRSCGVVALGADITKPETLAALTSAYDWVVNCVSSSGGGTEEYRRVYLDGMRNIIRWLGSSPPQRYVYTSSTSVYGQTDGSVVDETSPIEPVAETGKILVETERLLQESARSTGLDVNILRLAGIYGPGRGYWLRQYLNGQARLEGRGERWLNMIQRDDVVGTIAAVLQRRRPGEIYNVVDDEPVTQLALYQWLSAKTGGALPRSVDELGPEQRKRGLTNKRVSNRKLKDDLGYRLEYPSFREGFKRELEGGL